MAWSERCPMCERLDFHVHDDNTGANGEPVYRPIHPLQRLRKAALLSHRDLARRSGVSVRTIQAIEAGQASPRMSTRRRLLLELDQPLATHEAVFGPLVIRLPTRPPRAEILEARLHELLWVLADAGLLKDGRHTFYDGTTMEVDK